MPHNAKKSCVLCQCNNLIIQGLKHHMRRDAVPFFELGIALCLYDCALRHSLFRGVSLLSLGCNNDVLSRHSLAYVQYLYSICTVFVRF